MGAGGGGALTSPTGGGGVVQTRESPEFRSAEVGIAARLEK